MQVLLLLLNILYCKTKVKAQGASIPLKELEIVDWWENIDDENIDFIMSSSLKIKIT